MVGSIQKGVVYHILHTMPPRLFQDMPFHLEIISASVLMATLIWPRNTDADNIKILRNNFPKTIKMLKIKIKEGK